MTYRPGPSEDFPTGGTPSPTLEVGTQTRHVTATRALHWTKSTQRTGNPCRATPHDKHETPCANTPDRLPKQTPGSIPASSGSKPTRCRDGPSPETEWSSRTSRLCSIDEFGPYAAVASGSYSPSFHGLCSPSRFTSSRCAASLLARLGLLPPKRLRSGSHVR